MTDRALSRLACILTSAGAGYIVLRTLEAIGRGAGCMWWLQ